MPHRSPTAADIGKQVEVRNHDNEEWKPIRLVSIDYDETSEPMYWERNGDRLRFYYQCRVPYTCPDPIAELSMAADKLVELGADEAARVLMEEIERRQKPVGYSPIWPQEPLNHHREFSELLVRTMAQTMSIPQSLLVQDPPNPEPQP